ASGDGWARGRGQRALSPILQEELAPGGGGGPVFEDATVANGPPVVIVICLRAKDEDVDERRAHEDVLNALQRPEPDHVAHPAGAIVANFETPALGRGVLVAHDADLRRIADAQA